jgi:hypothetical protein
VRGWRDRLLNAKSDNAEDPESYAVKAADTFGRTTTARDSKSFYRESIAKEIG